MNRRMQMVAMQYPRRERRIGARAAHVHHEVARNIRRDPRPELAGNDVQREIQSCGDPCAGEHGAVFDENAVVVHARLRGDALFNSSRCE